MALIFVLEPEQPPQVSRWLRALGLEVCTLSSATAIMRAVTAGECCTVVVAPGGDDELREMFLRMFRRRCSLPAVYVGPAARDAEGARGVLDEGASRVVPWPITPGFNTRAFADAVKDEAERVAGRAPPRAVEALINAVRPTVVATAPGRRTAKDFDDATTPIPSEILEEIHSPRSEPPTLDEGPRVDMAAALVRAMCLEPTGVVDSPPASATARRKKSALDFDDPTEQDSGLPWALSLQGEARPSETEPVDVAAVLRQAAAQTLDRSGDALAASALADLAAETTDAIRDAVGEALRALTMANGKPRRVLLSVVDKRLAFRLGTNLASAGYAVDEAGEVGAALRALAARSFDAVVCDDACAAGLATAETKGRLRAAFVVTDGKSAPPFGVETHLVRRDADPASVVALVTHALVRLDPSPAPSEPLMTAPDDDATARLGLLQRGELVSVVETLHAAHKTATVHVSYGENGIGVLGFDTGELRYAASSDQRGLAALAKLCSLDAAVCRIAFTERPAICNMTLPTRVALIEALRSLDAVR